MVYPGGQKSAVWQCSRVSSGTERGEQRRKAESGDRGCAAWGGAEDLWLSDFSVWGNGADFPVHK